LRPAISFHVQTKLISWMKIRETIDWARRAQFIYTMLAGLASIGFAKAILRHISSVWLWPICLAIGAATAYGVSWLPHREGEETAPQAPPDPCIGLFSPLQLEVFQLAKDMRSFLAKFEPIPPANYGGSESQKLKSLSERTDWRRKLGSSFQLQFNERMRTIELKLGANNIQINRTTIMNANGRRGLEVALLVYANVLTAMAHRLDGVVLDVNPEAVGPWKKDYPHPSRYRIARRK
jgi:hypothetical protein